jgi:hypothetical protein
VTQHTARIVDKGNQLCLTAADRRSEHRIGLPQLIGILHAEGESALVFTGVFFEHFILVDHPGKGIARDVVGV